MRRYIYSAGVCVFVCWGWGDVSVLTKKHTRRFTAALLTMTKTGNSLSVNSTVGKYITVCLINGILSTATSEQNITTCDNVSKSHKI